MKTSASDGHEAERRAIKEAAELLLATAGPKPSIESLRQEAGLAARWILTHRHADLKDKFLLAVNQKWGPEAPAMVGLEKKLKDLQDKYDRLFMRAKELESLVNVYAAVIDQLTNEIAELEGRRELRGGTTADENVTPMRWKQN